MTSPVAVGVREHTGWAWLVAVAPGPVVTDRRRVELLDHSLPRQPYHAGADGPIEDAMALVARVEAAALEGALGALRSVTGDVVAVAVAAESGRIPDSFERIMQSHTLWHAAEGALYREAVCEAAARLGIPVTRYDRTTVLDRCAVDLTALGRALGPPWQRDHKEAVAGALTCL